jgi:hypothetical protein
MKNENKNEPKIEDKKSISQQGKITQNPIKDSKSENKEDVFQKEDMNS